MGLSIAPLCCVLLLGVVGLANASAEEDGDNLNTAVMAAKFLYDTLSAQETATAMVRVRCCTNCPPCPDEIGICKCAYMHYCVVGLDKLFFYFCLLFYSSMLAKATHYSSKCCLLFCYILIDSLNIYLRLRFASTSCHSQTRRRSCSHAQ